VAASNKGIDEIISVAEIKKNKAKNSDTASRGIGKMKAINRDIW